MTLVSRMWFWVYINLPVRRRRTRPQMEARPTEEGLSAGGGKQKDLKVKIRRTHP